MNYPDNLTSDIRFVTTQFSEGVAKENEINTKMAEEHIAFAGSCGTAQEYYESNQSHAAIEYAQFVDQFKGRKLKVLDIGVGRGESSVYLASQGHQVFSVEPSLGFCKLIAYAARKFNLNITPVCAVGEEIDKINESNFDLVIFNASLHHCDDPGKALKNVFSVLKPGGMVFLCSEIQIRPWVNKKQWYWRLENFPEEMGHYGGNEHAYYSWEYKKMLNDAGFSQICRSPGGQFLNPFYRIRFELKQSHFKKMSFKRKIKFLVRCCYHFVMSTFVRLPFLFQPLSSASLVAAQFSAVKN